MVLVLFRGTSSLSRADPPLKKKKKEREEGGGGGVGRAAGVSPQLVLTFVDVDHLDWERKPRCAALPFPTPSPLQQPGLPALPRAGRELLLAARSPWRMVGISGPLQCEYGARAGRAGVGGRAPFFSPFLLSLRALLALRGTRGCN